MAARLMIGWGRSDEMTKAAERLREIRVGEGLSLEDVAQRANTTNQMVGMLERGERKLTVQWLERLARALDVSVADIIAPVRATKPLQSKSIDEIIRQWLLAGLQKAGKSNTGLAAHLGLPQTRISEVKTGKRRFKAAELKRVAEYLEEQLPAEVAGVAGVGTLRAQVEIMSTALAWVAENCPDEFTRTKAKYELMRAERLANGTDRTAGD